MHIPIGAQSSRYDSIDEFEYAPMAYVNKRAGSMRLKFGNMGRKFYKPPYGSGEDETTVWK